ncbi:Malate dehydrogenase, cytoplasmic [Nucella lapillus]
MADPIKVCVTGAAGQVAYALIPSVAKGQVFGAQQPIILSLLDVTPVMDALNAICTELGDSAYPLLREVIPTDDAHVAFKDIDAVFLVGSAPRKDGMIRRDLLHPNARVFESQGRALNNAAKSSVKVLVVANPVNTNALVCSHFAPDIPRENFSCLTRLDVNRAQFQIASHLGVATTAVKNVIIWGNHSPTMFPDVRHARVAYVGKDVPVPQAINNDHYIKHEFILTVQKRGEAVIEALKGSSVMSAAKAAADHMRDWWTGTEKGHWVSMGVFSKGEYGIPAGLMYSFPVTVANKKVTIVEGLDIDDFAREKMDLTANELQEERKEAESNFVE